MQIVDNKTITWNLDSRIMSSGCWQGYVEKLVKRSDSGWERPAMAKGRWDNVATSRDRCSTTNSQWCTHGSDTGATRKGGPGLVWMPSGRSEAC